MPAERRGTEPRRDLEGLSRINRARQRRRKPWNSLLPRLAGKVRPGTAHGAENWEEVLLPEIESRQECFGLMPRWPNRDLRGAWKNGE